MPDDHSSQAHGHEAREALIDACAIPHNDWRYGQGAGAQEDFIRSLGLLQGNGPLLNGPDILELSSLQVLQHIIPSLATTAKMTVYTLDNCAMRIKTHQKSAVEASTCRYKASCKESLH